MEGDPKEEPHNLFDPSYGRGSHLTSAIIIVNIASISKVLQM